MNELKQVAAICSAQPAEWIRFQWRNMYFTRYPDDFIDPTDCSLVYSSIYIFSETLMYLEGIPITIDGYKIIMYKELQT